VAKRVVLSYQLTGRQFKWRYFFEVKLWFKTIKLHPLIQPASGSRPISAAPVCTGSVPPRIPTSVSISRQPCHSIANFPSIARYDICLSLLVASANCTYCANPQKACFHLATRRKRSITYRLIHQLVATVSDGACEWTWVSTCLFSPARRVSVQIHCR